MTYAEYAVKRAIRDAEATGSHVARIHINVLRHLMEASSAVVRPDDSPATRTRRGR